MHVSMAHSHTCNHFCISNTPTLCANPLKNGERTEEEEEEEVAARAWRDDAHFKMNVMFILESMKSQGYSSFGATSLVSFLVSNTNKCLSVDKLRIRRLIMTEAYFDL